MALEENITTPEELTDYCQKMVDMFCDHGEIKATTKIVKNRTSLQNKALHKGLKNAGEKLAAAGITKSFLYENASKNHHFLADEEDAKEIVRAIALSRYGERSTTAIPPGDVSDVWEIFSMVMSERISIDVGDFPSIEGQRIKSLVEG